MSENERSAVKNNDEIAREIMTEAKDSWDLAFDPNVFPRLSPIQPRMDCEVASEIMPQKTTREKDDKNYDLASEIMPAGENTNATHMHKNRFRSK